MVFNFLFFGITSESSDSVDIKKSPFVTRLGHKTNIMSCYFLL